MKKRTPADKEGADDNKTERKWSSIRHGKRLRQN